jgi:hypothetical protein
MSAPAIPTAASKAGARTVPSPRRPPSAKSSKTLAQLFEAASVVLFAAAWGILIFRYSFTASLLLMALLFAGAVVSFRLALKFSYAVAEDTAKAAETVNYEVSPLRVKVLQQAKAGDDVTECLNEYLETFAAGYPPPMKQENLLLLLKRRLGDERTAEVETVVLKYTRVHEEKF